MISGVVTTKTAGMTPAIASVLSLANTSADSLAVTTKGIFGSAVGSAGVVVYAATLKRANSDFETGDLSAIFHPEVATNSPDELT
jgi:hypothetical protein